MALTGQGLVIFSDLDGSLLDHANYRWQAARRALSALRRFKVPLVLATSKTRVEVMPLWRRLDLRAPFAVENGGAIYVPANYFPFPLKRSRQVGREWLRIAGNVGRDRLRIALARAARRAKVSIRGFSQMGAQEVALRTGLSLLEARRARKREFDEPFVILDGGTRAWIRLARAIQREGLRATRGSRFFHIHGRRDKGEAVRKLTAWFREAQEQGLRTAGLGDSPNDIPLLRAVDLPFLVARPGGRYDAETLRAVPGIKRAGGVGPEGWNRAVLKLLKS